MRTLYLAINLYIQPNAMSSTGVPWMIQLLQFIDWSQGSDMASLATSRALLFHCIWNPFQKEFINSLRNESPISHWLKSVAKSQRTHDVIITPLGQNDVATSFWRNNDVITASCACWGQTARTELASASANRLACLLWNYLKWLADLDSFHYNKIGFTQ